MERTGGVLAGGLGITVVDLHLALVHILLTVMALPGRSIGQTNGALAVVTILDTTFVNRVRLTDDVLARCTVVARVSEAVVDVLAPRNVTFLGVLWTLKPRRHTVGKAVRDLVTVTLPTWIAFTRVLSKGVGASRVLSTDSPGVSLVDIHTVVVEIFRLEGALVNVVLALFTLETKCTVARVGVHSI